MTMIPEHVWRSDSPEATLAVGEALGQVLEPGDVVALSGPLGSGKTLITRGIAKGLGVPQDEPIVSPTFVLVREYAGRLRLYHLDTYRLGDIEELDALGFEEMHSESDAAVVVEWADRFPELIPTDAFHVDFEHQGPDSRQIFMRRHGGISPELVKKIGQIATPVSGSR